jgi:AbrB family looped-hinge helix DNA binding protein
MITTMDRAGRVVVPKAVRDALGLPEGGEVEIDLDDLGRAVLTAAPVAKRIEMRDGLPVVVPDDPLPPLSPGLVRATLEQTRR